MRGMLAGLVLCLAATSVFAEKSAVLNEDDVWKMYTTPQVTFMDINGNGATFGAIGIGTILNDHWYFGASGSMLINDIKADEGSSDFRIDRWNMWDAGGEIGYIFAPVSLVHLDGSLFLGGGQVEVDNSPIDGHVTASFLAIEPKLSVCVNMHETWEIGAGVGYRYTEGVDIDGLSDQDLTDITWRIFARASQF